MQKPRYWLAAATAGLCLCGCATASDPNAPGDIQGVTRNPTGEPLANAAVTIHSVDEKSDRTVTCGGDGSFWIEHLKPGKYELTARTGKFVSPNASLVDLEPGAVAKVGDAAGRERRNRPVKNECGAAGLLEPAGEGQCGRLA
jgi:hypothetical protein